MAEPDKKLSLIEEQLVIYKRAVSDGRVRVSTKTEFVTEAAEARLDSENVEVTRVAIGREVVPPQGRETLDCEYAARGSLSIWSRRNWAGERWPCRSISQFSL